MIKRRRPRGTTVQPSTPMPARSASRSMPATAISCTSSAARGWRWQRIGSRLARRRTAALETLATARPRRSIVAPQSAATAHAAGRGARADRTRNPRRTRRSEAVAYSIQRAAARRGKRSSPTAMPSPSPQAIRVARCRHASRRICCGDEVRRATDDRRRPPCIHPAGAAPRLDAYRGAARAARAAACRRARAARHRRRHVYAVDQEQPAARAIWRRGRSLRTRS